MNAHKQNDCWDILLEELDNWHSTGRQATFWWRDDDAIAASTELETMDKLSQDFNLPLSLAVIPVRLQNSLVDYLGQRSHISVLQHGYAHQSHAAQGAKKIEIGGARDSDAIATELCQGRDILEQAFGDQFIKVLVPPWNRIEARTYPVILKSGLVGLSSMWARIKAYPAAGLQQVNCHLDPVDWREDRGFIAESKAIEAIQLHLLGRRVGILDSNEPTGILTHHLDQSADVWAFCNRLFALLQQHPMVRWLDAREIWLNKN